jgi:hypothetical protein
MPGQAVGGQSANAQNVSEQNVLGLGLFFIVMGGNRSASSLLGKESNR